MAEKKSIWRTIICNFGCFTTLFTITYLIYWHILYPLSIQLLKTSKMRKFEFLCKYTTLNDKIKGGGYVNKVWLHFLSTMWGVFINSLSLPPWCCISEWSGDADSHGFLSCSWCKREVLGNPHADSHDRSSTVGTGTVSSPAIGSAFIHCYRSHVINFLKGGIVGALIMSILSHYSLPPRSTPIVAGCYWCPIPQVIASDL